jgi:vacuolar-type H+-ATPase subunit C/Vma6
MRKTAISGSSGFVGNNLQNYLKDYSEFEPLSVRFIPYQKIEIDKDVIIHLAGKANDLKKKCLSNH